MPREQWLTPTQITEKLTAAGYKVTEIETDDGAYEVELVDKNGVRVEGYVHPATGELLVGYDD
ncbi:MAG: PepSY domain-containing protein [Hyphomicrobium sp.]|nr:PepSY domain-containing protein [Hyphomicrobium sp.]